MNKRRLLGLLCLMALLATSCDNKGDYWGAMEASETTMTLERICDVSTLSQDSIELLSRIMGIDTDELYRADAVMIGKVSGGETSRYYYPRFVIAKDKTMEEVIAEAYIRHSAGNTFYAFLDQNMLAVGETYYCAMNDYHYGYTGRPGLLDHVLGENASKEQYSAVKTFRLSGLPRLIVYDTQLSGFSCYLSVEVRSNTKTEIIEQGACYSSANTQPTIADQKTLARETRDYNYSNFVVEVTDFLPNTHYYVRPYVTTKEGTGYGPVVEFTTERGSEPEVNNFTLYPSGYMSVELYASFYANDFLITNYGYSYGIYSQETGMMQDEKNVEIPFTEDNGLTLSEVVNDLRPGTIYKFRVYVRNEVGTTYSEYLTFETPAE